MSHLSWQFQQDDDGKIQKCVGLPLMCHTTKGHCTIYTADGLSMGYRGAVEALHIDVDGLRVLTHMILTRGAI
jgi:hypothetical protein